MTWPSKTSYFIKLIIDLKLKTTDEEVAIKINKNIEIFNIILSLCYQEYVVQYKKFEGFFKIINIFVLLMLKWKKHKK